MQASAKIGGLKTSGLKISGLQISHWVHLLED
jgi:hypothetical protein